MYNFLLEKIAADIIESRIIFLEELIKEASDEFLDLLFKLAVIRPEVAKDIVEAFKAGKLKRGVSLLGRTGRYIPPKNVRQLSYFFERGTTPEYYTQVRKYLPEELRKEFI